MSEKIEQLNEEVIKGQIKELVHGSVEETFNELLEKEAEQLTQAGCYERNEARQGYRSGHYDRNLFQWLKGRGLDGVKLIVGDSVRVCWKRKEKSFLTPNTSAVLSTFTGMCSASSPRPK